MTTKRFLLFGVALLAAFLCLSLNAQQPAPSQPGIDTAGCTPVMDGDNLWTFDPGFNLATLAKENPDLKIPLDSSKRKFTTKYNQPGIKIWPGECLYGVERSGDNLMPTEAVGVVGKMDDPELAKAQADAKQAKADLAVRAGTISTLLWWIAGLMLALVIALWLMQNQRARALQAERERRYAESAREVAQARTQQVRDQAAMDIAREVARTHELYNAYSAPPVVVGGLPPTSPNEIEGTMLREAYRELPISDHLSFEQARATRLFYRIGAIEYGLLNGHVTIRGMAATVDASDAEALYEPKILRNEPGYRTTVYLPDGKVKAVYSLAACCNPVRTGNWMEAGEDFTFTPMAVGSLVAPAPVEPAPVVTPERTFETTTPGGGMLQILGPGHVSSITGDAKSMTITIVAEPPAKPPVTDEERAFNQLLVAQMKNQPPTP